MDCSTPGFPVLPPSPRACWNSCPLDWWYRPTISSSVVPLSSCLQFFPTVRVFSSKSVLHIRWPKYWSFNFSISPSNEYSWLISFRIDWFDLLAVQRTLKSLVQHHRSKASVLRHSAFFMVQLSHPYMTIGKTIALTRWTFIGKVMSLLVQVCHNFSSKEQASFSFMAAVTVCSDFGARSCPYKKKHYRSCSPFLYHVGTVQRWLSVSPGGFSQICNHAGLRNASSSII